MDDRSLFISSCSRRELARRRSTHSPRAPVVLVMVVLAIVVAAAIAARGGL